MFSTVMKKYKEVRCSMHRRVSGYRLKGNNEVYGALRFVGGTSNGTTRDADRSWSESVEEYTANNPASLTVSMGFALR
jgi:hypothetical protein